MSVCEVCDGSGEYLILNKWGKDLYHIRCPECLGEGTDPESEPDKPQMTVADQNYQNWLLERRKSQATQSEDK